MSHLIAEILRRNKTAATGMTLGRGPVRAVTTNFVARTTAHLYGGRLVALRQPTRCVLMRPQSTSAGRTDAVASPKPRTPLAAAVVGAATAGLFCKFLHQDNSYFMDIHHFTSQYITSQNELKWKEHQAASAPI